MKTWELHDGRERGSSQDARTAKSRRPGHYTGGGEFPLCHPFCLAIIAAGGIISGGGGGGPGDPDDSFLLLLVAVVEEDEELDPVFDLLFLRGGMFTKIMTAMRSRAVAIIAAAIMPPCTISRCGSLG